MKRTWTGVFVNSLLLAGLILLTGGCGSSDSKKYNEYERVIQLMDEGRYSEAIYIMDQRLQRHPQDLRARKLLAAGYAGRAGIRLRDYIDLSELVIKSFRESEIQPEPESFSLAESLYIQAKKDPDNEFNKILKHLSQWLKVVRQIEEIVTAFNKVPRIDTELEAADVRLSIATLEGNPENPLLLPRDLSLYRGLLRLTNLNYKLRYQFLWSKAESCQVTMEQLSQQVEEIFLDLNKVLIDVAASSASDSGKERVNNMARQLMKSLESFQKNSSSLEAELALILIDEEVNAERECP